MDEDQEKYENQIKQPPIGIIPRWFYDEQCKITRWNNLIRAIQRYGNAGFQIPEDWVIEYMELLPFIEHVRTKYQDFSTNKDTVEKPTEIIFGR